MSKFFYGLYDLANSAYTMIIITFVTFKLFAADCDKPKMPSDADWNNWLTNIKLEAIFAFCLLIF